MKTPETGHYRNLMGARRGIRAGALLLCATVALLPLPHAEGMQTATSFVIAGSQFRQRDLEDAGEVRLCIQNTGVWPLSMGDLKIRILAQRAAGSEIPSQECPCVYAKLSPPVLRSAQYGEIVAKLMDRPAEDCRLTCDLSTQDGALSHMVPMAESSLWISFVGFSQDLRRVFVYVENLGGDPADARLLHVGQCDMAGRARAIHSPIPPGDKGCLIGDLPFPLATGEFVHVVIVEDSGGRESKVQTVVRVILALPIITEFGTGDPSLGLDGQRPFLETMACPSHNHGTPKEAAAKFLQSYVQQFSQDPSQTIQIAICRSDMPKAWFRFGDLPDVAAMNTCLRPPSCYDKNSQRWFCPFSCVGDLAKRATEPGRFLAIIPTGPTVEEGSFLLKGLAPQEWRFLVCCAVASGAKGVMYRGLPANDSLSRDAFRQLNRELQYLKPLLLIAESVEWATTSESGYAAKSLLCGDQAVLIVVFDRRYFSEQRNGRFYTPPFGRTVSPARVNVRIPKGIFVHNLRTPFASLAPRCWNYQDGILGLTVDMVDSVQIYIASLQSRTEPSKERLPQ